jgi:Kef-type K+ transport system membrane component KefB
MPKISSSLGYAAMIGGAAAIFAVVRSYGERLTAPAAQAGAAATTLTAGPDLLLHVLLTLAIVLVAGRLLGKVLAAFRQPPVIGEVLAGIMLGPSLLGRLAPGWSEQILPPSVAPTLAVVAELSVILYMFLVGLGLHVDHLRGRARSVILTSHASMVTPFTLGVMLALYLYPSLSSSDVPFTTFALFMGVAMSITAFPVLARIVNDRGLTNTPLGSVALACAAAGDATAWCLLALVVGATRGSMQHGLLVVVLTLAFGAVMIGFVRPVAARLTEKAGSEPSRDAIAIALGGLLVSALIAHRIGTHAIFGAFLFGAVMPRHSALARALEAKLHDLVTILLLPAFFALTGMRTHIGLLASAHDWAVCGLIILIATAGKFGGTFAGARLTGSDSRMAASLGVLMNTRGLMELIVLNVGRDLNVISPTVFTMMVLMALVTTLTTAPLLDALSSRAVGYNRPADKVQLDERRL